LLDGFIRETGSSIGRLKGVQTMRITVIVIGAAVIALHASPLQAQQTLASSLGIQVFPAAGQEAPQQSQDEAACYDWAVGNTGSDPFQIQQQQAADAQQAQAAQQQASQAGKGAGARGAVRGAVAGAVIGEIASDDAGKGAAYGAAAGVVAGRHKGRQAQQQAQQQAQAQAQQTQQASQAQMDNFKKAFSACMEGKQYIAKF
jgi:hypothetical protein